MAIPLRSDFDAFLLRAIGRKSKDAPQARRLLALAAIYDGARRTEAARIGGGTVQIVRDTEAMNLHLAEITAQIAPGAHAVVILDQAGWHMSNRLNLPANITLMPLPPKCPELNPVENLWQFMRDNWLSNRVFNSNENIVDHCCYAWNSLIDQPWRIMSIGLRQWAHRF